MRKILFFFAIVSFGSLGMVACSEDDPVVEAPVPNPNPNVGKKLSLVHNGDFRLLGGEAIFMAEYDSMPVPNATFYVDGEPILGNRYTQSTIGEIEVHARKAGYEDSEVVKNKFAKQPY